MSDFERIKQLRGKTGVSVMACKRALERAAGDLERAEALLKEEGEAQALKKAERKTSAGYIDAYVHAGGKIGAMVELHCETDFVARNEEFQKLAHDLCMQVAAQDPAYLDSSEVPEEVKEREMKSVRETMQGKPESVLEKIVAGKLAKLYSKVCLLDQPFIKDEEKSISALLREAIQKFGENIVIARFVRFDIGR